MTSKLTFLTDPQMLKHKTGLGHPEQPIRLKIIQEWLNKNPEINKSNLQSISDQKLIKLLEKIHDRQLLQKVKQTQFSKSTYFDDDTVGNDKTYKSAITAAGLSASAAIQSKWNHSYFAAVRPPGHHATPSRVMGFCYLNNVGVASQSLLSKNKKVLIWDFDFHFGNGISDIFWNNPDVLYISTHADPSVNYPYQGFIDEIGEKDGKGFNIPIPLSYGAGDYTIETAFTDIIFPIIDQFNPDLIAVSAGFDAAIDDPVGGGYLQVTSQGFYEFGKLLYDLGRDKQIPIMHGLEGGYNIDLLPTYIDAYVSPWIHPDKERKRKQYTQKLRSKDQQTFKYVKQMLRPYWEI